MSETFDWQDDVFIGTSDIAPSTVHFSNHVQQKPRLSKKQWYEANKLRILETQRQRCIERCAKDGRDYKARARRINHTV